MVATDTIVGIVGATLLAAVMVGVFVYEYNNAPDGAAQDAQADRQLRDRFHAAHPALNATGDLNGDGIPNYRDGDLDGDGIPNANDTATAVVHRFAGTMPAPSPPATSAVPMDFKVRVEAGHVRATFTLFYNATTPAPLPGAPTLSLEVLGGEATASSPQRTQGTGSTAVTVTLGTEALAPGEYTLRVSQAQPGPGTAFALRALLDYGTHAHQA